MRRQELSGSVQRVGRFVEHGVISLEDVGHAGGDVEGDFDVGGGSLPGEADGVVEENLVSVTRAWSACGLSSGSASRLVSMVAPARVRSAYGDMTKAAAGRGSP